MSTDVKLMDHLYIKVDGHDLPPEAMDDLIEATVDSSLYLPDMFTIHLHDEELKWLDEGPFGLGQTVEISVLPEQQGASQVLIKGEITALEPDFGEGTQATLRICGYDHSHRLHRGTHSRTYLQMTDSDLVRKIARETGLQAQVDPTYEVYDHILQHNQTYMEFLTERAQRIGYELFVEDKVLCFRQPPKNGSLLELEWGQELQRFLPRLTLVEQVDEVLVRGWDPKSRQPIVGQATRGQAEPKLGQQQSGAELASTAFNSARRVVIDRDVYSQAEADTLAQAICDELSGAFIEAEGVCYGQAGLRAGTFVQLTALGQRFSGVYFVTAATHIYRADAAYMTNFTIHGRRPDTLYALLERAVERPRDLPGPVVGLVTNNKDPDGWGRVKVKFPWLSDTVESDWARLVSVGAGPKRGFYCLPEIDDEVLVLFEQGDVNRPYVIGGLWNGRDKPPLPTDQAVDAERGQVRQRTFKTRVGHSFILTDGADQGVVLETAGGHRLTMADEKKKIVLTSAGGHVLTLNDSNGEVTLKSSGNLTLSATNLKLKADIKMALDAPQVNINDGALEVI
jgi:phage protein D/phage baseplate assembly protein gpV